MFSCPESVLLASATRTRVIRGKRERWLDGLLNVLCQAPSDLEEIGS